MKLSNQNQIQNQLNTNTSYDNLKTKDKIYCRSNIDQNPEEIKDNLSEKANSVQTS